MAPVIQAALRNCRKYLVDNLTSEEITNELFEKRIISEEARERILAPDVRQDRIRRLLDTLAQKDDEVIGFLLDYFRETDGNNHIHDKFLEAVKSAKRDKGYEESKIWPMPKTKNVGCRSPGISQSSNFDANSFTSVSNYVKTIQYIGGLKDSECYKMNSNPRGLALLVNINNFFKDGKEMVQWRRDGSHTDFQNMSAFVREFGYTIFENGHENLMKKCSSDLNKQFSVVLEKFKAEFLKPDYAEIDSCIVVLMTHGSAKKGHIFMSDCLEIDLDVIVQSFETNYFPQFENKPKIFFIQACRECDNKEGQLTVDNFRESKNIVGDMYVLHSTVPLKVAYRSEVTGSPFINTLISVYKEAAHNTSILDLQTLIHRKMKEYFVNLTETQTSCAEDRGLQKKLYFNPGLGY